MDTEKKVCQTTIISNMKKRFDQAGIKTIQPNPKTLGLQPKSQEEANKAIGIMQDISKELQKMKYKPDPSC